MFDAGADIVYAAAGGSAAACSKRPPKADTWPSVWMPTSTTRPRRRYADVIMTSMLKNVNVATHTFVVQVADGSAQPGLNLFDLEAGGVGYSTSGGLIDHIVGEVELRGADHLR